MISDDDIRDKIRSARCESLQLKVSKVWDFIRLPKNEILCACKYDAYTGEILIVYDEDFNLLGEIDKIKIDEAEIRPTIIAINRRSEVYVTNLERTCVIITDMEFKKIATFSLHALARAYNVCCRGDYIYSCDLIERQVNIYTLELDLVHTIHCDCNPKQVEVSDTAICVNGNTATLFYSAQPDYKLLHRYERLNLRRISVIGSIFYEFSYITKLCTCFDTNGVLSEEIEIDRLCKLIPANVDVRFMCINQQLILYIPGKSFLFKFF